MRLSNASASARRSPAKTRRPFQPASPRSARAIRQRSRGCNGERQERGLMGPVFKQPPLLRSPPGGRVDQRTVIGSQPGEGRQVMGADQDVDAVDLVQGEPVDGFQPPRGRDPFRARPAKALGGKSDPPRLGEGKLFYFRHVAPLTVFRPNSGPISTTTAPARISTQPKAPMAVRRSPSRARPRARRTRLRGRG